MLKIVSSDSAELKKNNKEISPAVLTIQRQRPDNEN